MRIIAIASLALTASASAEPPRCVSIAELTAPGVFARFPAAPLPRQRWSPPDVQNGKAHAYRTALREGSHGAPNFAGRWTIVPIGCGAGTVCPAFVDRSTGQVRFVPKLRAVAAMDLDFGRSLPAFEILTYRPDSRLLVVLGAPNEDQGRAGANMFAWRHGDLLPIRFVPENALCGREA